VLNFGENGACIGELVGGVENAGMSQMFQMMNGARIAVGIQGLAIASTAYLNALDYARTRKQGAAMDRWKDPTAPRVPILQHADIRRLLLDMKARVEGIRSLVHKLVIHEDRCTALAGKNDTEAAYHHGQVELLTPIVKSYATDQAFHVCEMAIQVFGGAGYTSDYPVEQYCRDAKIFSIYEGTNHIQAMDLVGRKLGQTGGKNMQDFLNDVSRFVTETSAHPTLGASVGKLAAAVESLTASAMQLLTWFQSGKLEHVPLVANRFLEMMAEVAVGWLLLDQARIAEQAAKSVAEGHPDLAFYAGKRFAAVQFANTQLATLPARARAIIESDKGALEIPDEAFASV
jgi:alkylation response protein AidB-like acyl-CoA dehydrogenase